MTRPLHRSAETRTARRPDRLVRAPKPPEPFPIGSIHFTAVGSFVNKKAEQSYRVTTDDQFELYTMIRPNKATALFAGYTVGFIFDPRAERHVIVTDHFDDPLGTLRLIADGEAIADGWSELSEAYGRVVRGLDPTLGETYFETGGSTGHTHDSHADHTIVDCTFAAGSSGSFAMISPGNLGHTPHSLADHCDPFLRLGYIRRTS